MFESNEIEQEIIKLVHDINQYLQACGASMPATYEVQIVEAMRTSSREIPYKLQMLRKEADIDQHSGAVQLISEYEWFCRTDGTCSYSSINTFIAANSMGKDNEFMYTRKGHCRLLANLLLYCAACARRDMRINAIHIGTQKCYRCYNDYSVNIDLLETRETRNVNLGPSDRFGTWGTEEIYRKDGNKLMTREAFVAMVKSVAYKEITEVLQLMDREKLTRLALNPYAVMPS